jgi:Arc/MetJ family transcription regulator
MAGFYLPNFDGDDTRGGTAVTRRVIDLDDQLIEAVSKELGARTKKDTVNAALREVLETRRRAVALTRLQDAVAEGAFELELLEDKRNYRG